MPPNSATVPQHARRERSNSQQKRQHGQYFTTGNAFVFTPFEQWFSKALREAGTRRILEPFSGAGHIPAHINERWKHLRWACFDKAPPPQSDLVDPLFQPVLRDALADFPDGFQVAITNPPYLAKNAACRRGLDFPNTSYRDVYLLCLEVMLAYVPWVGAIVPESFVSQSLFRQRLETLISLPADLFGDTDCPVCLALFSPGAEKNDSDFSVWRQNEHIGKFSLLEKQLGEPKTRRAWRFNDPDGEISLIACDSTSGATIRFGGPELVSSAEVKGSGRARTRIGNPTPYRGADIAKKANRLLEKWRENTQDMLMTPFKGARKDSRWRRRLDFRRARQILDLAADMEEHGHRASE